MAYLENLQSEILNPHKPSKQFTKLPGSNQVNVSIYTYIETKDNPQELTRDQDKVHNQIFSFYNKLFMYKECNTDLVFSKHICP